MQVFYSLISSLKTYHRTLHFTPWSLDLFIRVPFQLPGEHTVLQPFRRIELIVHIAISVLPGTHFQSSEAFEGEVSCPRTQHLNNVPILRGENIIFIWYPAPSGIRNCTAGSVRLSHSSIGIIPYFVQYGGAEGIKRKHGKLAHIPFPIFSIFSFCSFLDRRYTKWQRVITFKIIPLIVFTLTRSNMCYSRCVFEKLKKNYK